MIDKIKLLLNVSGLIPKVVDLLKSALQREKIDYAFLSETWIKMGHHIPNELICYSIHQSETTRGYSGTGIFLSQRSKRNKIKQIEADPLHGRFVITKINGIEVVILYLSPYMKDENAAAFVDFILIKLQRMQARRVIFCGDFNFDSTTFGI